MVSIRMFVATAVAAASASAQDIQSSFTAGTDGWTVVESPYTGHITLPPLAPPLPAWDTADGQPAASIRIGDVFPDTAIRSPAAFGGDQLARFGGSLSWDIRIRFSDLATYPAVWLVGATKTLVFNTPSPPVDVWFHADVPLVETGWRLNGWQGSAATRGDLMEVLADLRGILINTEWRSGPDDTNVDNIVLASPTTGVGCYGAACAGGNGRWPTTWLNGVVNSGGAVGLEVTDGAAGSVAVVVVGFGPTNVPVFGCTAWILPSPTSFYLPLDASGRASLPAVVPVAPPGPLAVLQSVCLDAAAPNGFGLTLSNAVALTVQ